jgi:hypothetical protein
MAPSTRKYTCWSNVSRARIGDANLWVRSETLVLMTGAATITLLMALLTPRVRPSFARKEAP